MWNRGLISYSHLRTKICTFFFTHILCTHPHMRSSFRCLLQSLFHHFSHLFQHFEPFQVRIFSHCFSLWSWINFRFPVSYLFNIDFARWWWSSSSYVVVIKNSRTRMLCLNFSILRILLPVCCGVFLIVFSRSVLTICLTAY